MLNTPFSSLFLPGYIELSFAMNKFSGKPACANTSAHYHRICLSQTLKSPSWLAGVSANDGIKRPLFFRGVPPGLTTSNNPDRLSDF
jgi:hypothetical protein